VRIGIVSYSFAFSVVRECCGGSVVDVGLAVVCSWDIFVTGWGERGGGRGEVPSQLELLGSSEMV
jgi:hypothetical protein